MVSTISDENQFNSVQEHAMLTPRISKECGNMTKYCFIKKQWNWCLNHGFLVEPVSISDGSVSAGQKCELEVLDVWKDEGPGGVCDVVESGKSSVAFTDENKTDVHWLQHTR